MRRPSRLSKKRPDLLNEVEVRQAMEDEDLAQPERDALSQMPSLLARLYQAARPQPGVSHIRAVFQAAPEAAESPRRPG